MRRSAVPPVALRGSGAHRSHSEAHHSHPVDAGCAPALVRGYTWQLRRGLASIVRNDNDGPSEMVRSLMRELRTGTARA